MLVYPPRNKLWEEKKQLREKEKQLREKKLLLQKELQALKLLETGEPPPKRVKHGTFADFRLLGLGVSI